MWLHLKKVKLMAVPFLIMGRVTYLHHYVSDTPIRTR